MKIVLKALATAILLSGVAFGQQKEIIAPNPLIQATTGKIRVLTQSTGDIEFKVNVDGTPKGWTINGTTGTLTATGSSTSLKLSNNTYLSSVDAAGTGSVDMLKADTTDNTVIDAASGKNVKIQRNGTLEFTFSNDTIAFADSAIGDITTLTGLGIGVNGSRELTITNDQIAFSGAVDEIVPGATSISFKNNADSAVNLGIADAGAITIRGTLTSSATSDLGWTLVSGANTACNTTCTSACVMGQETTSKEFLACTDATADICLCAGAS